MNAANMLRSLLPLVVIVLVIAGWTALRQRGDEVVHEVDPSSTIQLAAARAATRSSLRRGCPRATASPVRGPTPGTPPKATR